MYLLNKKMKRVSYLSYLILSSIVTEQKKAVKKPKLMEFNDILSKSVEEEASGSSYRSKEILKKSMCSYIV